MRIVVNPQPYVPYAPEGLPALSDDGRELAILDAGNPNAGDEVAVLAVRVPEHTILRRFDLLRRGETQDMTSERLPERARMANEYLSARRFKPLPLLYELDWKYQTTPNEAIERFGLRIESEDLTGILTITDIETGEVGLRVHRPVKVVGPAEGHPDNHCWIRGQARQGWFDSASRLALLRIVNAGGGHYCDLPDEWLIVHLH